MVGLAKLQFVVHPVGFCLPQERGRGVFKAMYNYVMEQAASQDIMFVRLYVELENVVAQKAYESLGMKRMPYYMYDVRV